jgi:hypothetical protein
MATQAAPIKPSHLALNKQERVCGVMGEVGC